MRLSVVVFFLSSMCAFGQDPSLQLQMQQQSMQLAQQANQQMQQSMQQQNDLTVQQAAVQMTEPGAYAVATPRLSLKTGSYPGTIAVRMNDRTRGAVIYYTTDGWTPTTRSTRYSGPVSISSATHLQAIAVIAGAGRSRIASAQYSLPGNPAGPATAATAGRGTSVRVVFTAPFAAKGVEVGDAVPLALAEDLKLDDVTIPKGTLVAATVTHVDGPGWSGLPASLSFAVHSVTKEGRVVALVGSKTKDGPERSSVRDILPFDRGHGVTIPMGVEFTAVVAETKDGASSNGSR